MIFEIAKLFLRGLQQENFFLDRLQLLDTWSNVLVWGFQKARYKELATHFTFSMLNKAVVLAWRSLALDSWSVTVFLSSIAVEPMETMVRFIRSGDWTIRERVRDIVSVAKTVSEFSVSWKRLWALLNGKLGTWTCFASKDARFLYFQSLDILHEGCLNFLRSH